MTRARKRTALCKNKNKPVMTAGVYISGGTVVAVDSPVAVSGIEM